MTVPFQFEAISVLFLLFFHAISKPLPCQFLDSSMASLCQVDASSTLVPCHCHSNSMSIMHFCSFCISLPFPCHLYTISMTVPSHFHAICYDISIPLTSNFLAIFK